ncbi:mismatch-specific DNA-glycosylase [Deinococcus aquiradiocola]|uniref:Mismatch-specific DNA-glycosylase n=1 Tax=Deinococcus aquiradiocola TaxID=393059 RepID=A0A917US39_9DEIO|nr:mismatch-specific DNA-glycosylase [Deinococcus aquiradiocola]GGJ80925.1 mismatch-specific DNA-glycosylase [Deinococcus aquiradiocola]
MPDLLAPDLRLLLVGSAPSTISARAHAYYANPQNKFWRTLHAARITPRLFLPSEYPELLTLGVGLTDLAKRHAGADAALPGHAWDRPEFLTKVQTYRPRTVAFTSKRAASEALGQPTGRLPYGLQVQDLHGAQVWVLPSTSPLADTHFRLEPWLALGETLHSDQIELNS